MTVFAANFRSTITNNFCKKHGGGISVEGRLTISNSIVAGNSLGSGSDGPNIRGTVNSLGNNIFGDTAGMTITGVTTGNYTNQDARLAPLADNGGATKTHATLPDSVARNHGSNALAVDENNNTLQTDQRGIVTSRISEGTVDIGSFEHSIAEISVSDENGANILDGGSFDFGQTPLFNPIFKTFRISNQSSEILKLANLRLPAGFTLFSGFPEAIGPSAYVIINVRLDANAQGAPSGTLSFDTNDDDENPYNFTISGTIGSPPSTAVASIASPFNSQNCAPLYLSQRVTFTQPINGLTPENFALVDVNNSVIDEEVASVTRENDTSYLVSISVRTGDGTLRLAMVNRNGTNAVITNLPYTGPNITISAAPPVPAIEAVTSLPAQPNSTGNQLTTPDDSPNYRWVITSGTGSITSADNLQTITYSVGGAGDLMFRLIVTAANGCGVFRDFVAPVYSVLNPVVTNTNDDGEGSLRQAILDATPGSTITFAANVRGTIVMTLDEMKIEKNLTIRGPGADKLTISGNDRSRIFRVFNTMVFNLEAVTLTRGLSNAESPQITGAGGAILNAGGTMTVKNVVVSTNRSTTGNGIGGGIASMVGGVLTVINSTFSGNAANVTGGALYLQNEGTVLNSTISGNSSGSSGGGIYANATLNLINSTVANNSTANKGGGIEGYDNFGVYAQLNIRNSIIANNILTGANQSNGPDISGRAYSHHNLVGNTAGMTIINEQIGNIFNPAGGSLRSASTAARLPHTLCYRVLRR